MKNDFGHLMEMNLAQVWSQRDASSRMKSIETIYNVDSKLYLGYLTKGHKAINESVNKIVENLPATFTFFKLKPVDIKGNIGRLFWGLGPNIETLVVKGVDIAVFKNGKIKSIYVFLDQLVG